MVRGTHPTLAYSPVTVQPTGCLFVGKVFNEVCNAGGRNITHLKTLKGSNLSNVVIKGTLTNNGWASNLTITKEGHLIGGNVTGYIVNDGLMENFKNRRVGRARAKPTFCTGVHRDINI